MAVDHPTHDQVVEATAAAEASMRPQSVPVNVYETPAALVVLAPLPAVTASDVTVEVRPGALRFWARLCSAGPVTTFCTNGSTAVTSERLSPGGLRGRAGGQSH